MTAALPHHYAVSVSINASDPTWWKVLQVCREYLQLFCSVSQKSLCSMSINLGGGGGRRLIFKKWNLIFLWNLHSLLLMPEPFKWLYTWPWIHLIQSLIPRCTGAARAHGQLCIQCSSRVSWRSPLGKDINFPLPWIKPPTTLEASGSTLSCPSQKGLLIGQMGGLSLDEGEDKDKPKGCSFLS